MVEHWLQGFDHGMGIALWFLSQGTHGYVQLHWHSDKSANVVLFFEGWKGVNVTRTFARCRYFLNIFQASIYLEKQFFHIFPLHSFYLCAWKDRETRLSTLLMSQQIPQVFSLTWMVASEFHLGIDWDLPHNTCRWSNSASEFQLRDLWDSWIRGWVCLTGKKPKPNGLSTSPS